jgi:hypothetical protein
MYRITGPMPSPELHAQRFEKAKQQVTRDEKAVTDKWKECRDNKLFQSSAQDTISMKQAIDNLEEQYIQGAETRRPGEVLLKENLHRDIEAMLKLALLNQKKVSKKITDGVPGEVSFERAATRLDSLKPITPLIKKINTASHNIELAQKMDALRISLMRLAAIKREGVSLLG